MMKTTANLTETVLLLVLYVISAAVVTCYFLRVLQRSYYKAGGYFAELGVKLRWLPLIFVFVPAAAYALDFPTTGFITGLIFLGLLLVLYNPYPKESRKYPVITHRMERLIGTLCIFWVGIAAGVLALSAGGNGGTGASEGSVILLGAAMAAIPVLVVLANVVNRPFERVIQNRYITEARRILTGNAAMETVGITGSYGKTSLKYYLEALLKESYRVCKTPESYNTQMGIVRTVRGILRPDDQIFLCEMGATQLHDVQHICNVVQPTVGIITSLGEEHMDTFHSMQNVVDTAFELFTAVEERVKKGDLSGPVPAHRLFVNGDDPFIQQELAKFPDAVTYGLGAGCAYRGEITNATKGGIEFTVTAPDGTEEAFNMKLIGRYNAVNMVGAIAVAHSFGVPMSRMRAAVWKIEAVPHRMQLIPGASATVIDDTYNSDFDDAYAALQSLELFTDCVKILITTGRGESDYRLGAAFEQFGRRSAAVCDYIVVTGEHRARHIRRGALEESFPPEKILVADSAAAAESMARNLESGKEKVILKEL